MDSPGSTSVLLLPGLAGDQSWSMKRYARELHAALCARAGGGLRVRLEEPPDVGYLSALIDTRGTRRLDRMWSRWVAYPHSLYARRAGVFHILDHGYAQLIRSLAAGRTIVTCHDVIPLLAAQGVIPGDTVQPIDKLRFRSQVRFLQRARRVVAVSAATKATLERYTPIDPDRISVVPNGLSPAFRHEPDRRARLRAEAGLGGRTPVVLQVATGVRYKNTEAVLRAMAKVRTRVPDVVLVRVGAPLASGEAQLAAALGLAGCLTQVGNVSDDRLVSWYNAADLLLFPSTWEGFGWPPLEAMACGTPVVASAVPPIEEVVGEAALLVPPHDSSALATAAERLLTDAAVAAALRNAGLLRARQFTWTVTAARMAAIYDEVART